MFSGGGHIMTDINLEKIAMCKPRFFAASFPLDECLALATSSPQLTDQISSRLVHVKRDYIPRVFVGRSGNV